MNISPIPILYKKLVVLSHLESKDYIASWQVGVGVGVCVCVSVGVCLHTHVLELLVCLGGLLGLR